MSFSRCGLQYQRGFNISDDYHNHPRWKQLSCWIIGDVIAPKESTTSIEVVDQELENKMDIAKEEKQLIKAIRGDVDVDGEQKGSGVMDMVRSIPIKRILAQHDNLSGIKALGETFVSKVSNIFPSSDENARDIFPGEYHAIVKLPNGKYGRANYSGPGTHIVDRLRRRGGDPPRVLSDKVSQAHDIRYALAQQQKDPERAVRDADEIYVKKMRSLQRDGLDSSVNIQPAMRAIQAKMVAEDFSLLSRDKFIDTRSKYDARDTELLSSKLKELKQEGYGGKGASLAGGHSVRSRRKTRLNLDKIYVGNPKFDFIRSKKSTTSIGSRMGYLQQKGGAQAPGTAQTTSSQNIDVKTKQASHRSGVVDLKPTYFDNQYGKDKRAGSSRTLGHYGIFQGQSRSSGFPRSVNASNYDYSRAGIRPVSHRGQGGMGGKGYPGSKIIQSDVINVVPHVGKGASLAGAGVALPGGVGGRFPADKLLKKMAKKVSKRTLASRASSRGRKPVYFDDVAERFSDTSMSHFLARKLAPMISVH